MNVSSRQGGLMLWTPYLKILLTKRATLPLCIRSVDQRQLSSNFMSAQWRRWSKMCFKEKTDSSTLMVSPILERLTPFRVRFFLFWSVCISVGEVPKMWTFFKHLTLTCRDWSRSWPPASGFSISVQKTAGSSLYCHEPEACHVSGCKTFGAQWGQGGGNPQKLSA